MLERSRRPAHRSTPRARPDRLWNASLGEDEIRVLAAALPKCATIKAVYLDWNPLPSRAAAPVAAIEATPGGKDEGGEGKGEEEKGGDGGDGDGDGDGDSKAQAAAPASPADVYVASSACGMPSCAVSVCVRRLV